ncbi:MAG: M48 family metallopeptidase [Planctomycetota bacterium]
MIRHSRWAALGAAIALMLVPACQTNPETGRSGINLVPDSYMNSLGAQAYAEVKQTEKRSTDQRLTAIVERVAGRITAAAGEQMEWEVTLVESPQANAFVLPGGKIVVYTGILPICQTEAALAFVLGHEVGHAIARHGSERASQTLIVQGGLTLADLSLGTGQNKELIMGVLGTGAQYGVLLPYSRAHESDADHTGIRYMARAGYDPRVAPDLWLRMGAQGQEPPEFSSTHPNSERRASDLQGLMKEAMEIYEKAPVKHGVGEAL